MVWRSVLLTCVGGGRGVVCQQRKRRQRQIFENLHRQQIGADGISIGVVDDTVRCWRGGGGS